MQARYYDPVIGRFYSNDPVGFTNVHTFNRYANNNPYKYTDPDGKFPLLILFAPELIALGNAALFTGSAALAGYAGSEAINAYNESSEEQPEIKKQKQDEHKKGTPGNKNRTKQNPGNPPSTWDNPSEADDLTQDAWENGTTDPNNSKIKTLETGRRVGTTGDGTKGQFGVKVHQDSKGKIHGHPYGVDKSKDKT